MRKARFSTVAAAASVVLGACSSDITVPNYNNPTTAGVASDPGSLQLLANGVLYQLGNQAAGYISILGSLGRESYNYTPTEGRNFTAYVQARPLDRAGFAGVSLWAPRYTNLRNLFNLQTAVTAANITTQQKSAASGFAKTMEGLELYYVISTRDTIGAPVEVSGDLTYVAPFVTRDSVYRYISARLDEGATELTAGGAAFPFTVSLQFTGLGAITPTTFRGFNRAIAARVLATRGSLGMNCGATSCYQQALTAVSASFLGATTPTARAGFDAGVYNIYATSTGAVQNTLSAATTGGSLLYAHPSILRDTTGRDANGRSVYSTTEIASRRADLRVAAKIRTLAAPASAATAIQASSLSTPYGFNIFTTASSPIPVIRAEELVLIRAEANIQTGNLAAGLADINAVRTGSGGAANAPLGAFGSTAQAIDALLAERRLSLLWEGHRILDVRRFNRLNTLPLDKVATSANNVQHFIESVIPVPQAECLSRALVPELQPAICRL